MNKNSQKPHLLLWIDDVLTLIGIGVFLFSAYIFPFVFFDLNYPIPHFIFLFNEWCIEYYGLVSMGLKLAVFLPFLLTSIVCFLFSKLITFYLERQGVKTKPVEINDNSLELNIPLQSGKTRVHKLLRSTRKAKLLLILIGIVVVLVLVVKFYLFDVGNI